MRTCTAWAVVALSAVAGCQSTAKKMPYSDNPLLLSREPLTQVAPAAAAPAASVGWSRTPVAMKPAVPIAQTPTTVTPTALALTPAPLATAARAVPDGPPLPPAMTAVPTIVPASIAALPLNPGRQETTFASATPAPELNRPDPVPAPVIQQVSVPAVAVAPAPKTRLDAAADYSWIQGELDCHYRGYKELRFRSPSDEDAIGGKVRLVDDAKLASFRTGDLLLVEGDLTRDDAVGGYPRYTVRSVRLVGK